MKQLIENRYIGAKVGDTIGDNTSSTRVLCAIYPIGEITLDPGEFISFSLLHA